MEVMLVRGYPLWLYDMSKQKNAHQIEEKHQLLCTQPNFVQVPLENSKKKRQKKQKNVVQRFGSPVLPVPVGKGAFPASPPLSPLLPLWPGRFAEAKWLGKPLLGTKSFRYPPRELTYPTLGSSEHHLQNAFFGGSNIWIFECLNP